ncbi:MAG: cytochrome-c peroxidase [Deferrisomatales bacterium]
MSTDPNSRLRRWRPTVARLAQGLVVALTAGAASAQQVPVSLDQVEVPRPTKQFVTGKSIGSTHDLAEIIPPGAEAAAVRLGKAFFWDMQAGSNGDVACATCHFHAGTDNRTTNTMNAGPDGVFGVAGPNRTLTLADFPFRRLSDPEIRPTDPAFPGRSTVLADHDDVVGAQGVPRTRLDRVIEGVAAEPGRPMNDRGFHEGGRNVRQATGRNTPTVINAVFNFANFLDGRANHFFNGVNPFGPQDPDARVWVDDGAGPAPERMLLNNSSLASQAVGPPLNDVEMSWVGRTFPDLGRKLLSLTPLATQTVHPTDSVLGAVANSTLTGDRNARGLGTTYRAMIEAAFAPRFWRSAATITVGGRPFTQMEANFALFWGLAIQMYESTLVSDDTPFDRFLNGDPAALTSRQQQGMNIFFGGGIGCGDCHIGPELTAAAMTQLLAPDEAGLIEVMPMAAGVAATYDIGFYNIGVRPTAEDRGRGGKTPFNNPLSFARQAVMKSGAVPGSEDLGFLNFDPGFVPAQNCIPDPFAVPVPRFCPPPGQAVTRVAVDGAFKVPGLRNVELTGPYFHHGGMATLMQVVEFYTRGGDFFETNIDDLDPVIRRLSIAGNEPQQLALADFMLALTDERVRQEAAPFDHPELRVPDGHTNAVLGNPKLRAPKATAFRAIPAVGAAGRAAQGLAPVRPFLWDGTADFHLR